MHPDRFSFFFFPSAANNSGLILKVGAQIYHCTDRSNLGTLSTSSLYTSPHACTHTFGFTINKKFPTKNQ